MSRPRLYVGTRNASSWAMRAWLALKASGYDFDEELVDIRRPQRFRNLAVIGEFSPPAAVPVLDTGRTVIYDSNAIMEFANDSCDGRLLPRDIEARAHARSLIAWQHAGLSSLCHRISFESAFYPLKRPLTDAEQDDCNRLFQCYEATLDRYGDAYLFGDISLADFMHAPTVVRLARHSLDTLAWPRTEAWMRLLLAHPLVSEWLAEADRLPHIWYDDYLVDPRDPATLLTAGPGG
ncbi:glutathione S-transferase N-terminal domain-containing protein [Lysobacter sp. F6437]|uniref:glutathione S-transferase N-terminal domain-containing protein n=1 Tax=Lysobacter sp. F6437 TaxID=3459296 RepID=UPI00403D75CF